MDYVIRRTDQRGGYLAPPGSPRTYVRDARKARRFLAWEAAAAECCPENEVPETL